MRQRRNAVTMVAAILVLLLAIGAPVGAATAYTDPQGQFSFMVPDGFQQQTDPTGAVFFRMGSLSTGGAIFFINVGTAKVASADDYVIPQPIGAGNTPVPLVTDQPATLGGQQGHRFEFADTNAGTTPYYIFVTTSKDLTPYSVVFVTGQGHASDFESQLQAVVTTFSFSGTPNSAPASPANAQPASQPAPAPTTAPTG